MSAVLEPTAAPTTPNAVEYVRALSPDDQEAIFVYLLKELIRMNGGEGLIPLETENGEPMGYYVPPKVAAEEFEKRGPKLTAEQRAEIQRRIDNPGKTFSFEEMKEWLREEEPVASLERG